MSQSIQVLILEDRPSDAVLITSELKRAGYEVQWYRVDSEQEFIAQLRESYDLILADFSMPAFGAARALQLLKQSKLDIPFIIISGSIGEERAVEMMKEGAADYLLKDRLGRLGQAVAQALEQKQLREQQRNSDLRFRAIFNQTFEFVGLINSSGIILEVNQPALDFFQIPLSELIGIPVWDFPWLEKYPNARGQARQFVNRAAVGEFIRRELVIGHGDRGARTFDFSIKPVTNESDRVELLIVEARDITEQKRLEEQFRQSQKMEAIGKLAGGVAHDFNNLLTIILSYNDLLRLSLSEDGPQLEMLDQIHRAGMSASELTHQLLAFSRKQVLKPAIVNLNSLLEEMQKMLRRLIGEDVELDFKLAADLWSVRVDPGQMEQVLMNLVANARDAMPQGGRLTFETANFTLDTTEINSKSEIPAGEYVLLIVRDTGIGMDEATLARIFEPFFTTKDLYKGTGLGLSMVYGIIKQSGGHAVVNSEIGCGSTFKIYLPRDQNQVTSHQDLKPVELIPGSETLLLVEDDQQVRCLARTILESQGYKILEARDGQEALEVSRKYEDVIHLLVTDVIMPFMSGRELAEQLLASRAELKVLYLSGYMDDAVVRHGLQNAEVPFLQKPYTPKILSSVVRRVLDGEQK